MPNTFSALAVLVVALLPGALYVWAFEREAGPWGIGFADRVLRFIGGSAIFHALLAPFSYWVYSTFVASERLTDGRPLPWLLWVAGLAYVFIPLIAGFLVGRGTASGKPWARIMAGPHPEPRAFDHLFARNPTGWVRVRLKSTHTWLGGAFATLPDGRRSYASRYPEEGDLYLVQGAEVDPTTGQFRRSENGRVVVRDAALLIGLDEVDYLEFIHR